MASSGLKRTAAAARYICLAAWVSALVTGLSLFIIYPAEFTPERIAAWLLRFEGSIWLIYLLLSALRGVSLLPSTPLVVAGTLLFPGRPWEVFAISLFGIVVSSSMIYFFSDRLGLHSYFERHDPARVQRLKDALDRPTGAAFVGIWAFFPLVPTDFVCYLAGTAEMSYWKFITAIICGEAILCRFYIFFGGEMLSLLR